MRFHLNSSVLHPQRSISSSGSIESASWSGCESLTTRRSSGGHEHCRQAGEARQQCPLCRLSFDVDEDGMRRRSHISLAFERSEHSSSASRLWVGLRRARSHSTKMDGSLPSMPRCTACRLVHPASGATKEPPPRQPITTFAHSQSVQRHESRFLDSTLSLEVPDQNLHADWTDESKMLLSARHVPTTTEWPDRRGG